MLQIINRLGHGMLCSSWWLCSSQRKKASKYRNRLCMCESADALADKLQRNTCTVHSRTYFVHPLRLGITLSELRSTVRCTCAPQKHAQRAAAGPSKKANGLHLPYTAGNQSSSKAANQPISQATTQQARRAANQAAKPAGKQLTQRRPTGVAYVRRAADEQIRVQ